MRVPYIRTRIGEHDFHKPACFEYCRMAKEACPFFRDGIESVEGIERWTDIADHKLDVLREMLSGSSSSSGGDSSSSSSSAAGYEAKVVQENSYQSYRDASEDDVNAGQLSFEDKYYCGTCWCDGSGFEYDSMSRNVIGPGGPAEEVYDITKYGIADGHSPLRFSEWNAWVDKFQYDYRYGRVSDMNAECVLFPNVDNPWMMTEYVFQGVGGGNSVGKTALSIPEEYVVEPPLYDPATLSLVNGDLTVGHPGSDYGGKYASYGSDENTTVRRFRRVEDWDRMTEFTPSEVGVTDEQAYEDPSIYALLSDQGVQSPSPDGGLVLYCAKIPVQSVKWGEHGNIPPHSLDMTAPPDWLDPTASVAKIRARYVAHVGTPFYATGFSSGPHVVFWAGKWAGLLEFQLADTVYDSHGRKSFTYQVQDVEGEPDDDGDESSSSSGGPGVEMYFQMPRERGGDGSYKVMAPFEKVMGVSGANNLCHSGCSLCTGSGKPYGVAKCGYLGTLRTDDNEGIAEMNGYFDIEKCTSDGGNPDCPHRVRMSKPPLIATYQVRTLARDQVSRNVTNASAAGALMGAAGGVAGVLAGGAMTATMMANEMDKMAQQYRNLDFRGEPTVTYELKYEVVHAARQEARLNKKKYTGFGKGVQIVPGTGKYAFDSKENANPFGGGDTNAYDDISTLSFPRFFRSVMHCATQANCHYFASVDQAQGWQAGEKAGGDGKCRYYRDGSNGELGCPYCGVPKRALEFAMTAKLAAEQIWAFAEIYETMTGYGCWSFTAGAYYRDTIGRYRKEGSWVIFDNHFAVKQESPTVALVAVRIDSGKSKDERVENSIDCSPAYHGVALPADPGNLPTGYVKYCKFRTVREHREVMVSRTSGRDSSKWRSIYVYHVVDGFFWFKPLYNSGGTVTRNDSSSSPENLRQHVDDKGYWFCKADRSIVVPGHNTVMVDNSEKFIGGWHPEYKDYSKIGSEFMQDVVSEESREGQGMGDYVQNGDYPPIPQSVNKKGYWVDQSGEYIVDERDIGYGETIARMDERESNGGSAVCISFRKSNTEMDGETGEQKQPKVKNAALFSNDPAALVDYYSSMGWPEFDDPEKDNAKYKAPFYIKSGGIGMLPTMRHALHCPKCDYYISFRYYGIDKCPWCGSEYETITGDTGTEFGGDDPSGKSWKNDAPNAKVMRKFFKLYSIGNAEVWAPPGTSLRTDAYFWRHQAVITNATRRQILHRLGERGGNGYLFNHMSRQSEMTLGLPEGLGRFEPVPEGRYFTGQDGRRGFVRTSVDYGLNERYGKQYIKWRSDERAEKTGMFNRTMPRHMIPFLYKKGGEAYNDLEFEDEGVIAPYTESSDDALKMVSVDQMRAIRNAVEPMYAYVLKEQDKNNIDAEFPMYRASYDQRETINQPIIYNGRRATLPMVVLAVTDDGRDSYQRYYSGDPVYGNVCEYFPSGYTWWWMKGLLGGRYTEHREGMYHMDDTGLGAGRMVGGSGGEYTCGTRTVAKCAVSIYGVLPLDKKIEKAYIIIEPDGTDPSKDPIGLSWTGGPVMYCHYHALPRDHHDQGRDPHLHGTAGYPDDQYFDDDGNFINPHPPGWSAPLAYNDESAQRLWGEQGHTVDDDRFCYYEENFSRTMTSLPGLFDTSFYKNVGTPKKSIMDMDGNAEIGMGYDASSFPANDGFTPYGLPDTEAKRAQKYQYIVVDEDGDIVEKYPDSVVWKRETQEQIEKTIERHTADMEFTVSNGTEEGRLSYSFSQSDSNLYGVQMPDKAQEITGYFDMSWSNTKGYVDGLYDVEDGSGGVWNSPVIFQDEGRLSVNGQYSGGGGQGQAGTVPRVMDVTSIVSPMYEDRVARRFGCHGGKSLYDISLWGFYEPIAEGLELDGDIAMQNVFHTRASAGRLVRDERLLTDIESYPELDGDVNSVPEISEDGDKYELAKRAAEVTMTFSLPLVVNSANCWYADAVNQEAGTLEQKSYDTFDDVKTGIVEKLFPGCKFTKVSDRSIRATSESTLRVQYMDGDCWGMLGVAEGVYTAGRDRTVQSSASIPGFEPVRLLGDDGQSSQTGWRYDVATGARQSFTFDLLRAPLLKKERDWRYEQGDEENPGDGIRTYFYDMPFSEDPAITSVDVKPSSEFPSGFRVMAKRSEGDVWTTLAHYECSGGKYRELFPNPGGAYEAVTGALTVNLYEPVFARFVKVECESSEHYEYMQLDIDEFEGYVAGGGETGSGGYQLRAKGNFTDYQTVSFAGITACIGARDDEAPLHWKWLEAIRSAREGGGPCAYGDMIRIVSAQILGASSDRIRIAMDRYYPMEGDRQEGRCVKFFVKRYRGGVDAFRVYGAHYKTEEGSDEFGQGGADVYAVKTGGWDEYQAFFSERMTTVKLPFTPSCIWNVSVGQDGSGGVHLVETGSREQLRWSTEEVEVTEVAGDEEIVHTVRRINGGTYFYDPFSKEICLPRKDQSGVDMTEFEKEAEGVSSFGTMMPDTLQVVYFSGNGKSVTLKATADGDGPSYMLEKNAINTIVDVGGGHELLDTRVGSCKIIDPDTGKAAVLDSIPFVCYNDVPSTLSIEDASRSNSKQGTVRYGAGEFRLPTFNGKELAKSGIDDDGAFVKLFGECCGNCRGKCSTEVTFTGPPDYFITGDIKVEAPAVTERTMKINGESVKYTERTGGIRNGVLIVSCAPASAPGGRMTLCYKKPTLLIYASEVNHHAKE